MCTELENHFDHNTMRLGEIIIGKCLIHVGAVEKPDWERKESVRMYNIFASLTCSVNRKVGGFRFLTLPVSLIFS